MAHRGADDAFTFDLVTEDDGEGAVTAEEGGPTSDVPPGWVARHLTLLVPAFAAVVALLVTAFAVSAARERQQDERVAQAPGGVVSLVTLPGERWRLTDAPQPVAVLGGLLVTRNHDGLQGLDPVTGAVRWRIETGARVDCGSSTFGFTGVPTVGPLVCLDGSEVLVVEEDGTLSARRALHDLAGSPRTGPDGSVLRAERVGPVAQSPAVECNDRGDCRLADGAAVRGPDAVVRLEDAATGALRWERTVDFDLRTDSAGNLTGCRIRDTPTTPLVVYDDLDVVVHGSLIQVVGCGVNATFTASGIDLTPPSASFVQDVDGRYFRVTLPRAETLEGVRTEVLAPDGSVLREIAGYPAHPLATSGTGDAVVTVQDAGVVATRSDGTERVLTTSTMAGVLVVDGSVVLIEDQAEAMLLAVDLATGEDLWRRGVPAEVDLGPGRAPVTGGSVITAFTDGDVAMLVYQRGATVGTASGYAAFGLGLRTGEVLWSGDLGSAPPFAVAGHLVTYDGGSPGMRGLG